MNLFKRLFLSAIVLSAFAAYSFVVFAEDPPPTPLQIFTGSLGARQETIKNEIEMIKKRFEALNIADPKWKSSEGFKKTAEGRAGDFLNLSASDAVIGEEEPFAIKPDFLEKEKAAINAINDFNQNLLIPFAPKSVPKGDIMGNFIPQAIRLLMYFLSTAVLVSFVYSGVLYVTAYGEQDKLTKAKKMLYYSLIGFAIVLLAFAAVRAITDINFFGR